MSDLTYSADDLRGFAQEAIDSGDFDTARDLADNAKDTEEAQGTSQG